MFQIIVIAIALGGGPVWETKFAYHPKTLEECQSDGSQLVVDLDQMFQARGVPVSHTFKCSPLDRAS